MMQLSELPIGTRVFNGGDMANIEHFGTITDQRTTKWSVDVEITPDEGSDRSGPYWIPIIMFSPKYLGHGGTRFVTKAAYDAFREERIAEFRARYQPQS